MSTEKSTYVKKHKTLQELLSTVAIFFTCYDLDSCEFVFNTGHQIKREKKKNFWTGLATFHSDRK